MSKISACRARVEKAVSVVCSFKVSKEKVPALQLSINPSKAFKPILAIPVF